MDISSPGALFTSLLTGLIGFALIVYAKKAERVAAFLGGAAVCVLPYVVHGVLATWGLTAACILGAWMLDRRL